MDRSNISLDLITNAKELNNYDIDRLTFDGYTIAVSRVIPVPSPLLQYPHEKRLALDILTAFGNYVYNLYSSNNHSIITDIVVSKHDTYAYMGYEVQINIYVKLLPLYKE
jgi:hypothetical protein